MFKVSGNFYHCIRMNQILIDFLLPINQWLSVIKFFLVIDFPSPNKVTTHLENIILRHSNWLDFSGRMVYVQPIRPMMRVMSLVVQSAQRVSSHNSLIIVRRMFSTKESWISHKFSFSEFTHIVHYSLPIQSDSKAFSSDVSFMLQSCFEIPPVIFSHSSGLTYKYWYFTIGW